MYYFIRKETLTKIADAIRSKANIARKIDPVDMPSIIDRISTGGTSQGGSAVITAPARYIIITDAAVSGSGDTLTIGG